MTVSPEVALARLLLAGTKPEAIDDPALRALLRTHRRTIARMRAMLAGMDHAAPADVASIAARFDRAVRLAPEASVAAYSLGDPAILAAATAELVGWLRAEHLVPPGSDVLDLGCGIGRVAAALAPLCRSVLGVDVAAGMIAEARRRHAAPNLSFATIASDGLAGLPAQGFDLVLAVDVFPYLVQAGVAARHVADAARVLRPGGHLAIFNLSYRGPEADRADAARWAADQGLGLRLAGAAAFTLWDATAFLLAKPSTARPTKAESNDPANTAAFSSS